MLTTLILLSFGLSGLVAADPSVTYPGIGTFHRNDFFDPIHRPINFLPQSPEQISPNFLLFTRKNTADAQSLHYGQVDSVRKSFFNASLPTKIIVHGFLDNVRLVQWMGKMKDKWLEKLDANVIIVDWSGGNLPPYGQATANTRVVGPLIGLLIETIGEATGTTSLKNFHLLGHSLGAHIVGYCGKFLSGTIEHITGLDPAGPYFEGIKPEGRLWHTDAKFVESIHTDAQNLNPTFGYGMYETCSHIDFYPNGGRLQPGCTKERFTAIIDEGLTEGARRLVFCNHQRAIDFYMSAQIHQQAATPKAYLCDSYDDFKAGKCADCGVNGEKCAILGPRAIEWRKSVANNVGQGGKRFFFSTGDSESYFEYHALISIKMADGHDDEHGKIQLQVNDAHGDVEAFDFNQNDEIFRAGQTYTKVVLLKVDLEGVKRIGVKWTHGLVGLITRHRLYIDSIEVTPLTQPETKVTPTKVKLCPPDRDGFKNNNLVHFDTTC